MKESVAVALVEGEEVEAQMVPFDEAGGALGENRAEIDMQISTARAYPRSVKAFLNDAMEMATLDEDTAASMFYALLRSGKRIEGPSARLAEVVACTYGNLRFGYRVLGHDRKHVQAEGICADLQRNVAFRCVVKRRITDKHGKTFNDDMITVTGNAAGVIAMRNAVLKIVPGALWKKILDAAKETAIGDALTMAERRSKALAWFQQVGVTEDQVLGKLQRRGVEDITMDDLVTLRGMVTALKENEVSIVDLFSPDETGVASSATAKLNKKLAGEGGGTGGSDDAKARFNTALTEAGLDDDSLVEAFAKNDPFLPDSVEDWVSQHYAYATKAVETDDGAKILVAYLTELAKHDAVDADLRAYIEGRVKSGLSRRKAENDISKVLGTIREASGGEAQGGLF